jgi:hypothetical protein
MKKLLIVIILLAAILLAGTLAYNSLTKETEATGNLMLL